MRGFAEHNIIFTDEFNKFSIKGIISQLIDLDNGQTNFDLRLIALDLSTHKLLFSDVLDPQHLIITKKIIFYMK